MLTVPVAAHAVTLTATPTTLRSQLARLHRGDTLVLAAGTYRDVLHGPFPPGFSWDRPTTIRAALGATVIFAPPDSGQGMSGPVLNVVGTSYVSIEGLQIDASHYEYGASIGGRGGHHIRLAGVDVRNARGYRRPGETAWHGGPNVQILGHDNEVLLSKIHGSQHSYGIYIDEGTHHRIEGNEIYDNAGYGIHIYSGYYNAATQARGSDHHLIRQNRLWNNGFGRQQPAIIVGHGQGTLIEDNTLTNNYGAITVYKHAIGVVVRNNTLAGNGSNQVVVDPQAQGSGVGGNPSSPQALPPPAPPVIPPAPPLVILPIPTDRKPDLSLLPGGIPPVPPQTFSAG